MPGLRTPATITTLSDEATAMTADALRELLACPRCDAPLADGGTAWRCAGCEVDFPHVAGIPWLFAEPNAALGEWRGRLHFSLQRLERERQQIAAALASPRCGRRRARGSTASSARRAITARACVRCSRRSSSSSTRRSYETYLALRTRLPPDQGLTTYYPNIHRDWCWGDAENDASFETLAAALRDAPPRRVLVLGAGAGRLAYDLHAADDSRAHGRARLQSAAFDRRRHRHARRDDRALRVPDRARAPTQPCCERFRRPRRRARASSSCSPTRIGRRSAAEHSTRS